MAWACVSCAPRPCTVCVLCCAVLYCTVLYCAVLYCTVLYCTVLCCTVLYCVGPSGDKARAAEANLWRLASAHHSQGHCAASLNPLSVSTPPPPSSLLPHTYGLANDDTVCTTDILFSFPASNCTVDEAVHYLRDMYCGHLSLDVSAVRVSTLHTYHTH